MQQRARRVLGLDLAASRVLAACQQVRGSSLSWAERHSAGRLGGLLAGSAPGSALDCPPKTGYTTSLALQMCFCIWEMKTIMTVSTSQVAARTK